MVPTVQPTQLAVLLGRGPIQGGDRGAHDIVSEARPTKSRQKMQVLVEKTPPSLQRKFSGIQVQWYLICKFSRI